MSDEDICDAIIMGFVSKLTPNSNFQESSHNMISHLQSIDLKNAAILLI